MLNEVRRIRKAQKITIKEMSDFLGFKTCSTYSKKEREEIPTTIEEAKKISKKLNVSPMIFFKQ